jgi:methyl-accepting chemotaxis protein
VSEDVMLVPERAKKFEWNFNTIVFTGGLAFTIAVNVAVAAVAWNDTKRDIKEVQNKVQDEADARKSRGAYTDNRFDVLNKAVADIAPLSFQVTRAIEGVAENKKAVEATNERMDRFVGTLTGKIDTVIDSLNKIGTKVEVLSSKIDDANGKTDKSMYKMRIMRP